MTRSRFNFFHRFDCKWASTVFYAVSRLTLPLLCLVVVWASSCVVVGVATTPSSSSSIFQLRASPPLDIAIAHKQRFPWQRLRPFHLSSPPSAFLHLSDNGNQILRSADTHKKRRDAKLADDPKVFVSSSVSVSPSSKASQSSPASSSSSSSPFLTATPTKATSATDVVVDGALVNGKHVRDWTVERTMFQALHMAMSEEMERDKNVCVIGEDVGHYGGSYKVTQNLHYRFGNLRVMDTPIVENTFVGMGIGAAMNGIRPVVEGMNMGFLLLAFNQIANNAGMVRYTSGGGFEVPIVIRGPGGIGKQLGPEHSQRIEAYLHAVPGLKMVAPSTPRNARGLLKSAIRDNNPIVFFEHVLLYNLKEEIPLLPYTQPLDKAEHVREGSDVTLLAYSRMRHVAVESAQRLSTLGVEADVIDLISIKPLDIESIKKSISKTHKCIILDESSKVGGIGGEIMAQVIETCADELDELPVRLAGKDIPTPYNRILEETTVISPEDVVTAAVWMISSRKGALAVAKG